MATHPASLDVDLDTAALITQGAHFLGMTKNDLVAEAVRNYLTIHGADIKRERRNADISPSTSKKQRVAGLSRGTLTVSDDLDDPLPDEFWLETE